MMTEDEAGVLRAESHPCHASITIRIREINLPTNKNVLVVCAAGGERKYADDQDLDDKQDSIANRTHATISNPRSAIRNPKLTFDRQKWQRGNSPPITKP